MQYSITEITLNLTQKQFPRTKTGATQTSSAQNDDTIRLYAAKGETEGALIYFLNDSSNNKSVKSCSLNIPVLSSQDGTTLNSEISVTGYVPVTKPSIAGFFRRGEYPDALIPSQSFTLSAKKSQSCLFSVFVPRDTPEGIYEGKVSIEWSETAEEALAVGNAISADSTNRFDIPIEVTVYNVILPVTPFLHTRFNAPSNFGEPYYIADSKEISINDEDGDTSRYKFYMERFRINTGFKLNWKEVFLNADGSYVTDSSKVNEGSITADWTKLDYQVEQRMNNGIATFDIPIDVSYEILTEKKKDDRRLYEMEFALLNEHLKEKGWTKNFIWYNFDEPVDSKIDTFNKIADWAKSFAPDIPNLTTLGWASPKYKTMANHLDIWVPHINQYNTKFFPERQKEGDEVWIYTCIQNFYRNFPDNWKIDTYGTSHRALGWWLFKYNATGYLYWAMSSWSRNNPWENAETFPWGNGDGSLVYPPLDKKSDPYLSLRMHTQRDGFEDYDLLVMLKDAYNTDISENGRRFTDEEKAEIERILSGNEVIIKPAKYTKDDATFTRLHRRILELLDTEDTGKSF